MAVSPTPTTTTSPISLSAHSSRRAGGPESPSQWDKHHACGSCLQRDSRVGSDRLVVTVVLEPVSGCELYPFALHLDVLSGVAPGDVIEDIFYGQQPGNFGWLTWTGDPAAPVLIDSLTPPGDSHTYTNPDDAEDGVVSVGDWVYGRPGVANARNVRATLDTLKGVDMVVPLWDVTQNSGNNARYRVAGFAQVRLPFAR
jgi:hypothetical protein